MHEQEHTSLEIITILLAAKYPAKRGTAWPLTPWSLTLLSLVLLLLHLLTVQVSIDVSKNISKY